MSAVLNTVRLAVPAKLDTATAARYMGIHGEIDPNTAMLLRKCEMQLHSLMKPRAVWTMVPCSVFDRIEVGYDLRTHLKDCDRMILLAVTLGTELDSLLRRLSATNVPSAVVADALASAAVEQVCDSLERGLHESCGAHQLYATGRFSPGYGDCPLSLQPVLCSLLDTSRKIGLSTTESNLMTPRKSVTAIMGVAEKPVKGKRAGCGSCVLRQTCQYRKRGTTCASE